MVRFFTATKYVTGFALLSSAFVVNAATSTSGALSTPLNMTFCVYDIAGNSGDLSRYANDLALYAKKWNVNAKIKAYTDERVAAEDFKAGQCDGVALSTLRAKQFNRFIGSIDCKRPAHSPLFAHRPQRQQLIKATFWPRGVIFLRYPLTTPTAPNHLT
jgi:hypothetical protein